MKDLAQTVHHLRQRVFRAQKKYLSFHLKRAHYNCRHIAATPGQYKSSHVATCCTHPDNQEILKYEVPVGKLVRTVSLKKQPLCDQYNEVSTNCPYFTYRKEKQELQLEFRKDLLEKSRNPSEIAEAHPDIAQLLWVLGVESLESLDSLPTEPEEPLDLSEEEDLEGLRLTEQATMESAMDGYVPEDHIHQWEDDCPSPGGIHNAKGGLSCEDCGAQVPWRDPEPVEDSTEETALAAIDPSKIEPLKQSLWCRIFGGL